MAPEHEQGSPNGRSNASRKEHQGLKTERLLHLNISKTENRNHGHNTQESGPDEDSKPMHVQCLKETKCVP